MKDYLLDYDKRLLFDCLTDQSSREDIEKYYKLYQTIQNHIENINFIDKKRNISNYIEWIEGGLQKYYFIHIGNIVYAYAAISGNKDIYITQLYTDKNKNNINFLLFDFIIYNNLQQLYNYNLILDRPDKEYETWLKPSNLDTKIKLVWKFNTTIDEEIIKIWKNIFDRFITQRKINPYNQETLSFDDPVFRKIFPYIKIQNDLICKGLKNEDSKINNMKEVIYYNNLNYPNIPQVKKITNFEFCLPKYDLLKINKDNIKSFLKQMLQTLDYLHMKGIFHGDIKYENIVQDGQYYFYLIDFGLAEFYTSKNDEKEYVGTQGFRITNRKTNNDLNADLFSLAMVIIAVFTGRPNSKRNNSPESSADVLLELDKLKPILVDNMGLTGFDLLYNMLGLNNDGSIENPQLISAVTALNHKYFNEKYITILPDFYGTPIFIPIDWDKTFITRKMYNIAVDWLLLVADQERMYYITHLLTIQIFRKIIQRNIISALKEIQLYAISSCILASILNENYYMTFDQAAYLCDDSYTEGQIENCLYEIIKILDYKVDLIRYNYYIENDELAKIIFIYYFTFDYFDTSLGQFSKMCLDKEFNLKNKYDPDKRIFENVIAIYQAQK